MTLSFQVICIFHHLNGNYEVLGGQYNTKADAALGIGEDIWIYGDIYISVNSIENNILTFEIKGGIPEHIHSGGEATCVNRAVCEVCHEEYGELNKDNHKLQHVEAKAATVTQEGNTEYYYCSLCLKILCRFKCIKADRQR